MSARMPSPDGSKAAFGQRFAIRRVCQKAPQVRRHFLAVAGDQKIVPWRKQSTGLFPPSRNERNATGQRLERTDGRHPRKQLEIWMSRNVNRDAVPAQNVRYFVIGKVAVVGNAFAGKPIANFGGISDAVRSGTKAELANRFDEKF